MSTGWRQTPSPPAPHVPLAAPAAGLKCTLTCSGWWQLCVPNTQCFLPSTMKFLTAPAQGEFTLGDLLRELSPLGDNPAVAWDLRKIQQANGKEGPMLSERLVQSSWLSREADEATLVFSLDVHTKWQYTLNSDSVDLLWPKWSIITCLGHTDCLDINEWFLGCHRCLC